MLLLNFDFLHYWHTHVKEGCKFKSRKIMIFGRFLLFTNLLIIHIFALFPLFKMAIFQEIQLLWRFDCQSAQVIGSLKLSHMISFDLSRLRNMFVHRHRTNQIYTVFHVWRQVGIFYRCNYCEDSIAYQLRVIGGLKSVTWSVLTYRGREKINLRQYFFSFVWRQLGWNILSEHEINCW